MSINSHQSTPLTADDLTPVAAGGLLDRRIFLQRGLVFASAVAAGESAWAEDKPVDPAAPPWMREPGQPFSNYGRPSSFEKRIIRSITANKLVAGNGASWTPLQHLEGMITPTGLHFERHHNGVPQIDPAQHQLLIHGRVQRPADVSRRRSHPLPDAIPFNFFGMRRQQQFRLV